MHSHGAIGFLLGFALGGCATPEVGSLQWLDNEARMDFQLRCMDHVAAKAPNQPFVLTEAYCRNASRRAVPSSRR